MNFLLILLSSLLVLESTPIAALSGCSTPSFTQPPIYGVGAEPRFAATGDFNGDSKPDVVTANYSADSVSVLLNDGKSGFAGPTNFSTGSGPQAVAVGDFNGDSKPDLVVANVNVFTISLLLGDGTGNFGGPSDFNVGGQPFHIVTADFNKDGKLDLAVPFGNGNSVSVLLGNGAGGFSAPQTTLAGQQPQFLAVGDFNNDGYSDLAVCGVGSLQILAGNGTGKFSQLAPCAVVRASWIVAADINGDGTLDLVTTWKLSNEVSVLLNNGTGCFTASSFSASIGSGTHAGPAHLRDLNGDGKLDLLVSTDAFGFSVFLGTGSGNFGAIQTVIDGGITISDMADFNSDGRPDALAITPYNSVSIFFGTGNGVFANTLPRYAGSMSSGDLNGDGLADLIVASGFAISIFLGDGSGSFQSPKRFSLYDSPGSMVLGDFNNDGKADLAMILYNGQANVAIMLGDGAGNFGPLTNYVTGAGAARLVSGDFNGDGNLDVATAHSLYDRVYIKLGDGRGGLGQATNFPVPVATNISSFAVGDFNSDGKLDLVIPNYTGLPVFVGDGTGAFSSTGTAASTIPSTGVQAGDFNGDSKLDLVSTNANTNEISVVLGNGSGGFAAPKTFAANGTPQFVTFADFNGDGLVDIAVAASAPPPTGFGLSYVTVLLGDGAGGFNMPVKYAIHRPAFMLNADFNGDDMRDIVVSGTNGTLSVLLNTCLASRPTPTPTPTPTPSPTATPTPSPSPLKLILDLSSTEPNRVAALDSVLFVSDPFPVVNEFNPFRLQTDPNTRVIIFVAAFQLLQGDTSSSVIINLVDGKNQSHDIPAEDVRAVPNFNFTQVVFRLPNNLPSGQGTIRVKAHDLVSNPGTLTIRP